MKEGCFRVRTNHQLVQRFLNQLLVFAVKSACGLVQQQDAGVFENGTRDYNALALASTQHDTAFSNRSAVPVRNAHDEIMRIGHFGGTLDVGLRGVF